MQALSSTRSEMFSVIESWQRSGLSQKAYCQQHSIRYHQFHYWYRVYRDQKGQTNSEEPSFVALTIRDVSTQSPLLELVLPGGKRLVFYHQPTVDFLAALL